jgi:ketopantoate reductase
MMGKRIVFMGAGGVGAYIGGRIARAGEDVTLIDPWPEHIDTIKHNGLHLSGTQGEDTVRVNALHLHEEKMLVATSRMTEEGRPATGQDIIKGRRTEIEFINGLVAAKGHAVGVPAPTHAALTAVVERVERVELDPSPDNLAGL